MDAIVAEGLTKIYRVPVKAPGLLNAVRALLNRRWRDIEAVRDATFRIGSGEIVGFLGANGAGKTTTLKMLSGLLTPSGGAARVFGRVPWERDPEFQRMFSLVMGQRSQLWWEIPAQETFLLNKEIYGLSAAQFKTSREELVELLDLADCMSIPVKKLSLGQRMKAELAVSLLHRPKLLLLDEPTIGLDVVMQKKVRQFIRDYARVHGATVLLTSHNMDDVVELCSRVLIIERGRLLFDGELRKVVSKFAPHKMLRADFDREVSPEELAAIGRVVEMTPMRASIEIPRAEVSRRAAELLARLPVRDLTIEETPIDDIVRRLFREAAAQR